MPVLNESIVEEAALTWFGELGNVVAYGPNMAPGESAAERDLFTPDDVFGPPARISVPSSPNLAASSPNLAGVWVNKLLLSSHTWRCVHE